MAPTTLSKDREPDLESYNNFDNASTAGMVHPGDNEKSTRLKRCTSILCSSLGVASILVAYTICGAIVFSNLEGSSSRGILFYGTSNPIYDGICTKATNFGFGHVRISWLLQFCERSQFIKAFLHDKTSWEDDLQFSSD